MSRPSTREQSDDMQDDMTSLHTTPYIHMHSLTHIIPCSASDRHDTAGVSDLHREGRSLTSAGSIHALLCVRAEDDILVQAVAKYTTSDVFSHSWRQVASDLPGRLPQQCKERPIRLDHTKFLIL